MVTAPEEIAQFHQFLNEYHRGFDAAFFAQHYRPYDGPMHELEEVWAYDVAGEPAGWLHISNTKKGRCHIACLYVKPEFRNRGIGTQLLEWAKQRAKAWVCDTITLSVYVDNAAARRMYERVGFIPRYTSMYYDAREE